MNAPVGNSQIAGAQPGIDDISVFVAQSAAWTGDVAEVFQQLSEALSTLLNLDFVFLHLVDGAGPLPRQFSRTRSGFQTPEAATIGTHLHRLLGEDARAWPASSRQRFLDNDLSLSVVRIGRADVDCAVLVAGSIRPGFPEKTEKLLLQLAGNQALSALQREQLQRANPPADSSLMGGFPGFMAVLAPDGRIERVNREIEEYCGQTIDELQDWGTNGTVHPDDLPHVAEIFTRSIASGTPYEIEQRLRRFDGEYRWFGNRGRPVRDESGHIIAWHVLLTDIDDRKRAERALAANERNLKLTIDSIPALVWSARADGTGDFFNKHYLDYIGLSRDDIRDWDWKRVIHPDDQQVIANAWQDLGAAGVAGEVEARVRRHDGTYRWFLFRAHPLRDENGKVIKWYGVNVDIEEQKRAAAMLAGEKQLLEWIASGQPLRDVLYTLCTVVETASPGCHCALRTINPVGTNFEYGVAPSLPGSFTDSIAGGSVRADASPWGVAADQKIPVFVHDVTRDPRCNGMPGQDALRAQELKSMWCTPIASKSGKALGVLCVFHRELSSPDAERQDLMGRAAHIASIAIERLRAEEELRRREYLLATAERISETGSFVWDLDADEVVLSEQHRSLYEIDEHIARPNLRAWVHPDDLPLVDSKIARVMRGENCPENVERLLMPDGRIKYISTAFRVFKHPDGRRECIGVAQDITRRRLAEDALDRLRSELAHLSRVMSLGELAASIAHEVNQPVSGILTNASTCLLMLGADPPDIEGALKTAQRTIRDGNRAAEVLRRLRGLFRKQEFVSEPLNLNEAAQEVIAICSHDLQRRRIALSVNLDQTLPLVVGDRIQLQQVVLNLVLNAADAISGTDRQPRQICVETTQCRPGIAELRVRDTGTGVTAGDFGKLFEAFYTTKPNGMGIGLSVSKSILERHGGKIWAQPNEGPGSTFGFSIPLAPSASLADLSQRLNV